MIKGYDHAHCAKHKHQHEICGPIPKRPLLQHPAISVGEYHVEEEIESKRPEEQECGN